MQHCPPISVNNIQAHKWLNIAEANGHKFAQKNRALIEKRMTIDQIAEAQILAKEWMEKHGKVKATIPHVRKPTFAGAKTVKGF